MQYQKIGCCLMSALLAFLLFLPGAFAGDGYTDLLMRRTLQENDEKYNNNRWMDIPGRGQTLFYAQTNPFWAQMRYEIAGSSTYRRFGDGGCTPTSAAIAFANLLPMTKLGQIRPYARAQSYGMSTATMNPLTQRRGAGVLWFESAEDYQRYLPLVFGQFAAGNNLDEDTWRAKPRKWQVSTGGTGIGFVPKLCEIYGLNDTVLPGKMNMGWVEPVKNGAIGIALANSQWHPFASGDGHYIAIVGCDEEYVYIMDPQDKSQEEYENSDRNHVLDVMARGLIRVRLSDFYELHIGMIHLITNAEVEARLAQASLSNDTSDEPSKVLVQGID